MKNIRAIKLITLTATIAASFALAGCEEETECPAPTAEPAKSAAAIVSPTPAGDTKPAAAPTPPAAKMQPRPDLDAGSAARGDSSNRGKVDQPDEVDVDADLYVKRLVIARGVASREPVEPATSFPKGEAKRIYAFVEVGNRDKTASEVFVSFKPKGGAEKGRIQLRVGASPRWRTWAYTELATEVGEWEAIVRDASGDVIGTQSFAILDGPLSDDPYAAIDSAEGAEKASADDAKKAQSENAQSKKAQSKKAEPKSKPSEA